MHIHDCVVVPNFGGFLLHGEYANIDAISELIHPSNRKVSFNQKLNLNDGLLATFMAEELKISYADAIKLIEIELQVFTQQLNELKRLEIAQLGTFILNDTQIIQFIPNSRSNFLMSAFGLQPIQLHSTKSISSSLPIEKSGIQEHKAQANLITPAKVQQKVKRKRSGVWYTLLATFMIVVLLFNAYILLDAYPVAPLNNALSKMNLSLKIDEIFSDKKVEPKQQTVDVKKQEIKVEAVKVMPDMKLDSVQNVAAQETTEEAIPTIEPTINRGDSIYYIVVGAFRHNKKATALSEQLKSNGYSSSDVVKPKNYHFKLVTVGAFANMYEVSTNLTKVQQEIPDAWVCMSIK